MSKKAKKNYKAEHKKYIHSAKWLIKKSQLIGIYLKENWPVQCVLCDSKDNLHIHHTSYENFGNEILTDERINELTILCKDCHTKVHQDKDYFIKTLMEKVRW